jgi:hypothetical protein
MSEVTENIFFFFFDKLIVDHLIENFNVFTQLEGSLSCSQVPALQPYPDPVISSSHAHIFSFQGISALSCHTYTRIPELICSLQMALTKLCMNSSLSLCVLCVRSPHLGFILLMLFEEWCEVWNPPCVIF